MTDLFNLTKVSVSSTAHEIDGDELTVDELVDLIHAAKGFEKSRIIPLLRDVLGVSDSKWKEYKDARVYSFKLAKTGKASVEYALKSVDDEWVTRKEAHSEGGRAELYKAMDDLIPFALSAIELSDEWDKDELKLTGAVFKYADDEDNTMSVSLLLQKKTTLEEVLNMPPTPPRFERPPGKGLDDTKVYDSETARLVDRLINEIRRYLAGDRWS